MTTRKSDKSGHSVSRHVLITANSAWNVLHFRRAVIEMLRSDGYTVTVLAPIDGTEKELVALGCRFVPLKMNARTLNPISGLLLLLRMRSQISAVRPDAILSYTIKNNLFGAFAAKSLSIPFVPNVSGLGTAFLSGGPLRLLAIALYRQAFSGLHTVFFQNHEDQRLFNDLGLVLTGQARCLPGSGVNLEHFRPNPLPGTDKRIAFLMIARILGDKGVREFAAAAEIVKQRYPWTRFAILGPVDSDNRTAVSADELRGWQHRGLIEYLGSASDIRPHVREADCIVLPSYREGLPRSLLEGAAMGRPLIATDVPGCRQVVQNEQNGLLCNARDAKSLADAMLRMIELPPAARTAMGEAGRSLVEREFGEHRVAGAYREVLSAIIHDLPCPSNIMAGATRQRLVQD